MLKKIIYAIIINLFFLVILLLLGEVAIRILSDAPTEYSDKSTIDDVLGWKNKANYTAEYPIKEFGDDKARWYTVKYSTAKDGFRMYGDVDATRPKVLFIGDSYTQAVEVSDSLTFYYHLRDSLDVEIFAYGQAGWGTLQQYMFAASVMEEIRPDLIVWQTCDNDFIDNYAPLEYDSNYKVGLRRPYMTPTGKVNYRVAKPQWEAMLERSKFLTLLKDKLVNTSDHLKDSKSSQKLMVELGDEYEPYRTAQEVTQQIFKKAVSTFGDTPIYVFSASAFQPQLRDMNEQLVAAGLSVDSIPILRLRAMKWGGQVINSADGYHFNEKGHKLLADQLKNRLRPVLENIDTQ